MRLAVVTVAAILALLFLAACQKWRPQTQNLAAAILCFSLAVYWVLAICWFVGRLGLAVIGQRMILPCAAAAVILIAFLLRAILWHEHLSRTEGTQCIALGTALAGFVLLVALLGPVASAAGLTLAAYTVINRGGHYVPLITRAIEQTVGQLHPGLECLLWCSSAVIVLSNSLASDDHHFRERVLSFLTSH
jgi:hypothetical protein